MRLTAHPLIAYILVVRYYTAGEVLKALREKSEAPGKSQRTIAAEMGITPQYLSDILSDKRRITPEVAAAAGFRKQPDSYVRIK